MSSLRRRLIIPLVAAVLFAPVAAQAEPSKEDVAKADQLFREAQILVQKGNLTEGCAKYAESQRLDPANGTLLNIALCHEKEGKLGTAFKELQELQGLLSGSKSQDDVQRLRVVEARLKALDKKLPRLQLDTSELPKDAAIMVDSVNITDPSIAMPIDTGSHVVEITAPNKKAAKKSFDVTGPGVTTLKIEALADDAPPPPPPPPEPPPPPPPPPSFWTGQRVLGIVLIGVGVAGAGVGTIFGLDTFSKRDQRDQHCRGTKCDITGINLHVAAQNSALTSTIAFAAGGVALGVGTILFLTGGPKKTAPSSVEGAVSRLRVDVGPNGAGLQTGGTF